MGMKTSHSMGSLRYGINAKDAEGNYEMRESIAYDLMVLAGYKKGTWFPIYIQPPVKIHILINVKDWGVVIGMLLDDNVTFRLIMPPVDGLPSCHMNISKITHWTLIPEI
jgi:hypothetical protein